MFKYVLVNNKFLKKLYLGDNNLGKTADTLFDNLHHLTALETLGLNNNNLDECEKLNTCNGWQQLKSLKELYLRYNDLDKTTTKTMIKQWLPDLGDENICI